MIVGLDHGRLDHYSLPRGGIKGFGYPLVRFKASLVDVTEAPVFLFRVTFFYLFKKEASMIHILLVYDR